MAFFRMMAGRGDFMMVHEPFSYLAEFGYADIAGERITAPGDLISALSSLACRDRVFAKEPPDGVTRKCWPTSSSWAQDPALIA